MLAKSRGKANTSLLPTQQEISTERVVVSSVEMLDGDYVFGWHFS